MNEAKIEELTNRIAQLQEEIKRIKKEIVDKELRQEMIAERKEQLERLEEELREDKDFKKREIERERLLKVKEKIRGEIMKAASIYGTVHYKELAGFVECDPKDLLKILEKMITSKELFASIERSNVTFEKGTKPTSKPPIPVESAQIAYAAPSAQPLPGPLCPNCNKATRLIEQYSRYFCDNCQNYI
ncbi:MAG TPA: PCI domain-containing protein [Candidatus Deferrimicrobium sp.]|nr:PCI domain-containing protein [Candidatus Deferrimicrobium sp.]